MENKYCVVQILGGRECLWSYEVIKTGRVFIIAPPLFEIEGKTITAELNAIKLPGNPVTLANGAIEHVAKGKFKDDPRLSLEIAFRIAPDNPVVRFRYILRSDAVLRMTKQSGRDNLRYLACDLPENWACREIRMSEFDETVHSYRLAEEEIPAHYFGENIPLMGPILTASGDGHTFLLAYEHGSQTPDAFLQYNCRPGRTVELRAVKGNYCHGYRLNGRRSYETVWMQAAAADVPVSGMSGLYRDFILKYQSLNTASRQPYIYYNTWNYQERNKWWHGKDYLDCMDEGRMLAEIEAAARLGIDVFVIDTGWFERTGDWKVNRGSFPGGLEPIREKLDQYGMKMGLWLNPTMAGVNSWILQDYEDCRITYDGKFPDPAKVWGTERSALMCLVSRYWEALADQMIRMSRDYGAAYFKLDGVYQYGCDNPAHLHGAEANSHDEITDCYAFEQIRHLVRIAERVHSVFPDVIVDFDVTEGWRSVGLAFLSAGKYFLINNGPYYGSLDDPEDIPGGGMGSNVFVFPGPARARLCRAPLNYDRWIPSVLFLTHYLPDDPKRSQTINLASLVLGQNGIWGDLLSLSEEGAAYLSNVLSLYKQVRADITASYPVQRGFIGGSPEVHEKINRKTGKGAVAVFSGSNAPPNYRFRYTYVTAHEVSRDYWKTEGVEVSFTPDGKARLDVTFDKSSAVLVFFGVKG
ncbi:MAG: alpha-galactosidase [Bacillota bacterium]